MSTLDDASFDHALKSIIELVPSIKSAEKRNHILSMLDRLPAVLDEGKREKAMRWLGFMQGVLWSYNLASINDLKDMNR